MFIYSHRNVLPPIRQSCNEYALAVKRERICRRFNASVLITLVRTLRALGKHIHEFIGDVRQTQVYPSYDGTLSVCTIYFELLLH